MGQKPLLVDRHEWTEGLDPRRIAGPRGRWPPTYGEDVIEPLRKVWAVMDAPAGKPMAPFLGEIVTRLRAMSTATIDRRLKGVRAKLDPRGRSHTKPTLFAEGLDSDADVG